MKEVCLIACLLTAFAAGAAEPVMLFDFEDASQLERFRTNTAAQISSQWASEGTHSLRLDFAEHVSGQTPEFPGAACWREQIPARDWRIYRYYSFDVHVPQKDTYLGVIVQRTDERRDRMDRRYTFPKGTHRMWFNLKNAVAARSDMDTLANVVELEFFQSRPAKTSVVFIDNIRLTESFTGAPPVEQSVWVETLQELAEHPPASDTMDPPLDAAEELSSSALSGRAQRIEALENIAKEVRRRGVIETLAQTIDSAFPDLLYGVMIAPIEEHVFFSEQGVEEAWQHTLELDMLRGEIRSKQVVIFPRPGETLEGVRIEVSSLTTEDRAVMDAEHITLEMVGYVNLAESAMHRLRGFTDFGWYPDPILALDQPFDVAPPRQLQPVLTTIKVPRDAAGGRYTGFITVSAKARPSHTVPVVVTVHDATMPVAPRLPHLIHSGLEELHPDFRLNPNNGDLGSIYRWGSAVDPDKISGYVERGMNRFNLHRVSRFHLDSRCSKEGEERGAQGFVDYLAGVYSDSRMERLAALGLTDKAVFYGFDEVDIDNPVWRKRIELVFGALKQGYGPYGVKTATTARPWTSPDAWALPVDIWIPLLREYDVVRARLARERGIEVWWYSIDWQMFHRPLWSKALVWASFANEVDGWLYYHMCDWVDRDQRLADNHPLTSWSPLSEGTRGSYGTGAVVYWDKDGKPRPSLRLVNFREGMFDYDLLCVLRDRVEEAGVSSDFADRVVLAEARDLLGIPWRTTLNDYVVNHDTDCESNVARSIVRFRTDALRLLDALSGIDEQPAPQ